MSTSENWLALASCLASSGWLAGWLWQAGSGRLAGCLALAAWLCFCLIGRLVGLRIRSLAGRAEEPPRSHGCAFIAFMTVFKTFAAFFIIVFIAIAFFFIEILPMV